MTEHPERFIETNISNSWVEYLTNMEALLGVLGIRDIRGKKLPGYGIIEEKVIGIQDIEK